MSTHSPTTTPKPRDLRTPLQRAHDQLTAARWTLCGPVLSRSARQELADRIDRLTAEISSLSN